MKKIRALVILVILTALLAVPVAAVSGKATITSPNITAAQGETFTVTVKLTEAGKIDVGTVLLIYDTAALELLGGKCLVENAAVGQIVANQNAGTFLLMDPRAVSGDIFTFDMKVKDNASAGDYKIDMKASVGEGKGSYIDAVGTVVTVNEPSAGTTPPAPTEEKKPDPTTDSTPGSDPVVTQPVETQPADTQPADTQQTPDATQPEGTEGSLPADTENTTGTVADGVEQDTTDQTTKEPEGAFPWWIPVTVLVLAAAAAVVILNKKKSAK